MTYDELLARIKDDEKFLERFFGAKFKGQSALRAVVELHKPIITYTNTSHQKVTVCNCDRNYPCPTIRAIEKKLG